MQIGTLVQVQQFSLSGACLLPWIGRITGSHEFMGRTMLDVSNGTRTGSAFPQEVREIAEMLPVR